MGELERLQLEFARTGGTNQAAFVERDLQRRDRPDPNVQRRMEQARGDVLVDGKFTLAGEGGLYLEADYGVPAGNLVTRPARCGRTRQRRPAVGPQRRG
jgi:hypothetical protein